MTNNELQFKALIIQIVTSVHGETQRNQGEAKINSEQQAHTQGKLPQAASREQGPKILCAWS